ncbi:MAG TPA: c-type cytochrome [Nitrospirota bacterium]|nr:c-type cytochrome [Nitrospirota bacterium]
MKKGFIVAAAVLVAVVAVVSSTGAALAAGQPGETLFKQNCAVCHVDGGNIINPQKTLHKKDREANNVKTAEDIIKKMRNPGPGMTQFDTKTISDKNAHEIAEYILKTFNK